LSLNFDTHKFQYQPTKDKTMTIRKLGLAAAILFIAAASINALAITSEPISINNPGFEADGASVAAPTGWTSLGNADADFLEWGGQSSAESYRLSHWGATNYSVATTQTITGLQKGSYTLRAWGRRSNGQNQAYITLDCGKGAKRVDIPAAWSGQWVQVAVSTKATQKGECKIGLHTDAVGGEWTNFDEVTLETGAVSLPIRGADVSSLKKSEDLGGLYYNKNNPNPKPALKILKDQGTTHVRLRVWVNPADNYHNLQELREMSKRAKQQGLKVLVDLHYSDIWADPGHQNIPENWANFSIDELETAVFVHTLAACAVVRDSGAYPDMIQIGNELNSGMLWPYGHTWNPPSWENLARFLKAGYNAVKICSPKTKVVLHLAEGGNNGTFRWWFDNITAQGVKFDVIAASYYGYWHGSLGDLQNNLNDVAIRYNKDVLVAETAYPFTLDFNDFHPNTIGLTDQLVAGYPATPEGQAANLRDVLSIVRAVPNGRGLGVFYWDATWTAVPGNGWDPTDSASGNSWENQALFDFNGVSTPALSEFLKDK
jgi:arabinogalactan endo-1,4-beta-galactosidase